MEVNYYDCIEFPAREQREQYKQSYFDAKNLRLEFNSIFEQPTNSQNLYKSYRLLLFQDKIMDFNNIVSYFDLAVLRLAHYYARLVQCNKAEFIVYQTLFRQAYRNIGCEVFVYEEKIKDLLRFVYSMNKKSTKSNRKFFKSLKQKCQGTSYGKKFYEFLQKDYRADENVKVVRKIRNDEVHNSTNLLKDYGNYNAEYNHKIYETVRACLHSLCELRKSFDDFLVLSCQDYLD